MKLSAILTLAIAAVAQAAESGSRRLHGLHIAPEGGVVIPPENAPGYYHITFSPDYKQILNVTFAPDGAAELPNLQPRDEMELHRRQLPINYYRCFNPPQSLPERPWNAVWQEFSTWCNQGAAANPYSAIARGWGGAVAWMCNKSNVVNRCYGGEYDIFVNWISVQCGGLTPAFADLDAFGKSYGRTLAGMAFCS